MALAMVMLWMKIYLYYFLKFLHWIILSLAALSFCGSLSWSTCLVWINNSHYLHPIFYVLSLFYFYLWETFKPPCRSFLSPSDIMKNHPHLVIIGTGFAFGFLVVRLLLYQYAFQTLPLYLFPCILIEPHICRHRCISFIHKVAPIAGLLAFMFFVCF